MAKTRAKKSLGEKVQELDEQFYNDINGSTKDQINAKILGMAKYATELEEAKKNDEDLKSKQEQVSVANQAYSEPLNAIKLKTRYAFSVLKEKGA